MEILVIAILLGLIPAAIARNKGYSFVGFWIYGALLFIVALPHALLMKSNPEAVEKNAIASGGKKCPFCAEIVKAEAIVCKHCGRDLPTEHAPFPRGIVGVMIECPSCRLPIELRGLDLKSRKFQCPECTSHIALKPKLSEEQSIISRNIVSSSNFVCVQCKAMIRLDKEDLPIGEFGCPVCGAVCALHDNCTESG